ncbi:uncharacterized protein LOC117792399 [Drosophila innubila]|uniref:uncharacterized protein LOC117792399 n=1 Tax=Drosophila innubila TaxID=198719 RepID=UPI00148CD614|nr:uncharacterized protein LOC117792399 [Drosophila innubila]
MLGHKRNIRAIKAKATHSDEHVKLPRKSDALHPQQHPQQQHPQAFRERLEYNQHLNQRVTLCLELYHKNIIKKLSELNKINVYKLTKNVCQT